MKQSQHQCLFPQSMPPVNLPTVHRSVLYRSLQMISNWGNTLGYFGPALKPKVIFTVISFFLSFMCTSIGQLVEYLYIEAWQRAVQAKLNQDIERKRERENGKNTPSAGNNSRDILLTMQSLWTCIRSVYMTYAITKSFATKYPRSQDTTLKSSFAMQTFSYRP